MSLITVACVLENAAVSGFSNVWAFFCYLNLDTCIHVKKVCEQSDMLRKLNHFWSSVSSKLAAVQ